MTQHLHEEMKNQPQHRGNLEAQLYLDFPYQHTAIRAVRPALRQSFVNRNSKDIPKTSTWWHALRFTAFRRIRKRQVFIQEFSSLFHKLSNCIHYIWLRGVQPRHHEITQHSSSSRHSLRQIWAYRKNIRSGFNYFLLLLLWRHNHQNTHSCCCEQTMKRTERSLLETRFRCRETERQGRRETGASDRSCCANRR